MYQPISESVSVRQATVRPHSLTADVLWRRTESVSENEEGLQLQVIKVTYYPVN